MKKKTEPTKKDKTKSSAQARIQKKSQPTAVKIKSKTSIQNPRSAEYTSYAHWQPIPTVESVAMVAATLMGKKLSAPGEAVCQAIELMEIAAWTLRDIQRDHELESQSEQEKEEEELQEIQRDILTLAQKHFSFSEGAKEITGQKRKDRAIGDLQDILQASIASEFPILSPKEIKKKMSERISCFEKKGISGSEVLHFQYAKNQMTRKKTGRPKKI
jgi:hypothetical protein